ncbi:MAG: hypothetical protein Q4G60_05250 [bacterium]|nr:hypothetical protein [bacterium]
MKKIQKGQYGYIGYQKKVAIIRTLTLFAIAFMILIIGLYTTGTKSNALTIIAILGMLPASKSAVNMIMFLRYRDSSQELYHNTQELAKQLPMNYDLVFTMPDKSFQVQQIACNQNTVCGYRDGDEQSLKKLQQHISSVLQSNHLSNVEIKIWNDYESFLKRLMQMQEKYNPSEDTTSSQILSLLQAISL